MRLLCKLVVSLSLAAMPLCGAFAQSGASTQTSGNTATQEPTSKSHKPTSRQLTKKERKTLVAVALSEHVQQEEDESDCSHLVHTIYEQAGFPYEYAPSNDIYAGVGSFFRVKSPLAGDLVVWRGHVGVVIKPSQHTFFSSLSSGPGTDDYESAYWKHRGVPRFYRYVKKVVPHKEK
jgi:hypothetical protein